MEQKFYASNLRIYCSIYETYVTQTPVIFVYCRMATTVWKQMQTAMFRLKSACCDYKNTITVKPVNPESQKKTCFYFSR